MNFLKLSIVIPVYNVSQYIEKCIRSCYNQRNVLLSDYEIIIVNDGSTDDSLFVCEKLREEFQDLKIISQENKGLSGARNTGLKHANGQYVWFVDSDDWIEEDCLQLLFEQAKLNDVDIFWTGHHVIFNDVISQSYIPDTVNKPISGELLFSNYLNNLFYTWKFIYKKEFLEKNQLEFLEGILYEDLEFTPRALIKAKSCSTLSKSFYNYLIRPGSIAAIGNIKPKTINDRLKVIDGLNDLKKSNEASVAFSNALDKVLIESYIITIRMSARGQLKLSKYAHDVLKKIKSIKNDTPSNKTDFILIKMNLYLYHLVFKNMFNLISKIKRHG